MNVRKITALSLILLLTVVLGYFTFAGAAWGIYEIRPLYEQIPKSLDIGGGVSLTYQAADAADPELEAHMQAVHTILRKRLSLQGYSDASAVRQGADKIVVSLPVFASDKNFSLLANYLGAASKIEFVDADGKVVFSGADMTKVYAQPNPNAAEGAERDYVVAFQLNSTATAAFAETSAALSGTDKTMTVKLDDITIATPVFTTPIQNGLAYIPTAPLSYESAMMLVRQIKSGAYPVLLTAAAASPIAAALGENAASQAGVALFTGLLLVCAGFAIYYRLPGAIGALSLCIYGLLILFFLAVIPGIRLSLASIAGLLLAWGLTVGGHILLLENFAAEQLSGKSLRYALKSCFKGTFRSVWRPGAALLFIATVLLFVVKGILQHFAAALLIGGVIGLICATLIAYGLLGLSLGLPVNNKALFLPLRARHNREDA